MDLHGNARLCPFLRELMCSRVREDGWTITDAAVAAGCSERTCHKWSARFDAGEPLTDRSSRPHTSPTRTPAETEAVIETLRRRVDPHQPRRLRRSPARPNHGHLHRVPGPGHRLVHRSRRQGRTGHDRQRFGLGVQGLGRALRPARDPTPADPAVSAPHQRQSRTLHPDDAARVGLRCGLPELRPTPPGTGTMALALQQPTTPQRPRPQDTHQPPSTTRRPNNLTEIYN